MKNYFSDFEKGAVYSEYVIALVTLMLVCIAGMALINAATLDRMQKTQAVVEKPVPCGDGGLLMAGTDECL